MKKKKKKTKHKEHEKMDTEIQEQETPPPEDTVEEEILSIEELQRRSEEQILSYKDKYLRGLAESENLRKRLQKEKQDLTRFAIQNIVTEFLHPLDQMENALKYADQGSEEIKHWATGFQMILTHFKDVLTNHGVHTFESEGTLFDPHKHEAVEMIETDEYPEGTIVEEIVKGYEMGDYLLRPARVKVAKKTLNEEEKINEEENQES